MKRILLPILFVFALCIAANGQDVRNIERDRSVSQRSDKSSQLNEHKDWPARPQPSHFNSPSKPYYTRLEATLAVTNDTAKKVKEITWECTLLHPDTNQEVAKYTIVSKKKISPYGGAILKKKVVVPLNAFYGPNVVPPPQVDPIKYGVPAAVQAVQVNKLIEIKYTDGSVSRP